MNRKKTFVLVGAGVLLLFGGALLSIAVDRQEKHSLDESRLLLETVRGKLGPEFSKKQVQISYSKGGAVADIVTALKEQTGIQMSYEGSEADRLKMRGFSYSGALDGAIMNLVRNENLSLLETGNTASYKIVPQ